MGWATPIEMNNRPQTLYGIVNSPVGLAAWMIDHDTRSHEMIARVFDGKTEGLTPDDVLDNITLYWLTNTAISSARLYWDNAHNLPTGGFFDVRGVKLPVAVSAFPDEIYQAPRSWAEQAYPKLVHYNKLPKGGHFAAWEQPELFVSRDARDISNRCAKLREVTGGAPDARAADGAHTTRSTRAHVAFVSHFKEVAAARMLSSRQILSRPFIRWINSELSDASQHEDRQPVRDQRLASALLAAFAAHSASPSLPDRVRPLRLLPTPQFVRSSSAFPKPHLSISAGASPKRGGPTRRPSPIGRRALNSGNSRSSSAIGAPITTGARSRRNSTRCRMFMTEIDGVDIHFIHVKSRHANALPLIITHGWPGSVIEQLKVIDPLTNPTAHGGAGGGCIRRRDPVDARLRLLRQADRHGLESRPHRARLGGADEAPRLHPLRRPGRRLGLPRLQRDGAPGAGGIARHPHQLAGDGTARRGAVLAAGGPAPAGLSEKERAAFDSLDTFYKKYRAYGAIMGTRPQTIGYALTDSPAGLAAWMYDYNNGEPERLLDRDDLLDNVTLYWLTNTATSAARLYWETGGQSVLLAAAQKTAEISLPVAITVFPGRGLSSPGDVGPARLSQPHLLQRGRQGRPLRRVGTAGALHCRAPRRLQVAPAGSMITGTAAAGALAFGILVFSSPTEDQAMTISNTESFIVAQASPSKRAATADRSIQPFTVKVPQAAVDDLRRRSRRPAGLPRNSSKTGRRACSWRRCRSSPATGRASTTGASARQD